MPTTTPIRTSPFYHLHQTQSMNTNFRSDLVLDNTQRSLLSTRIFSTEFFWPWPRSATVSMLRSNIRSDRPYYETPDPIPLLIRSLCNNVSISISNLNLGSDLLQSPHNKTPIQIQTRWDFFSHLILLAGLPRPLLAELTCTTSLSIEILSTVLFRLLCSSCGLLYRPHPLLSMLASPRRSWNCFS